MEEAVDMEPGECLEAVDTESGAGEYPEAVDTESGMPVCRNSEPTGTPYVF